MNNASNFWDASDFDPFDTSSDVNDADLGERQDEIFDRYQRVSNIIGAVNPTESRYYRQNINSLSPYYQGRIEYIRSLRSEEEQTNFVRANPHRQESRQALSLMFGDAADAVVRARELSDQSRELLEQSRAADRVARQALRARATAAAMPRPSGTMNAGPARFAPPSVTGFSELLNHDFQPPPFGAPIYPSAPGVATPRVGDGPNPLLNGSRLSPLQLEAVFTPVPNEESWRTDYAELSSRRDGMLNDGYAPCPPNCPCLSCYVDLLNNFVEAEERANADAPAEEVADREATMQESVRDSVRRGTLAPSEFR